MIRPVLVHSGSEQMFSKYTFVPASVNKLDTNDGSFVLVAQLSVRVCLCVCGCVCGRAPLQNVHIDSAAYGLC